MGVGVGAGAIDRPFLQQGTGGRLQDSGGPDTCQAAITHNRRRSMPASTGKSSCGGRRLCGGGAFRCERFSGGIGAARAHRAIVVALRKIGRFQMKRLQWLSTLIVLVAFSSVCFAAGPTVQATPPQGQTTPSQAAAPAPRELTKVCIDAQADDTLIKEFADRLKDAIAASGALTLASATDSCSLQLHVPGNLLRFETAGRVMVSTVVIVTSQSGRYLSTSITACQAKDLKPCAVRAVTAAKLALLMTPNAGS